MSYIKTVDLCKNFGDLEVLKDVNLTVEQGEVIVMIGPSGAGKSSLVAQLLAADPDVHLSISHTTRAPRTGEVDGVAYHFVSIEDFEAMKEEDGPMSMAITTARVRSGSTSN